MIALASRDIGDGKVFLHRQYGSRLHNAVHRNCRQGDFGNVITKRVMIHCSFRKWKAGWIHCIVFELHPASE